MNKISKSFLCGLVLSSLCGTLPFSAFALSADGCHGGGQYQYCGWGRSCKSCPSNCYCPPRDEAKSVACTGWTGISCNASDRRIHSNTNSGIGNGDFGIFLCPADYPYSSPGAKNESDCYKLLSNKEWLMNWFVNCNPGQYLKKETNECSKCPTGYVCKGGSYHTSDTEDHGAELCKGGQMPNTDQTDCIETKGTCPKGEYFNKDDKNCKNCEDGHYCPGVTYDLTKNSNQGLETCQKGKEPNTDKTDCVDREEIDCGPGQYAPAGPLECKKCTSTTEFCPGGHFKKSSSDQGKYTCPFNSRSNSDDHASCSVTLTKEQMKYGPVALANKNSATGSAIEETQCWLYNSSEEYRACILGVSNSNANKSRAK